MQDSTLCHSPSMKTRATLDLVDGRLCEGGWRVRVELRLWPLRGQVYSSYSPQSAAKNSTMAEFTPYARNSLQSADSSFCCN